MSRETFLKQAQKVFTTKQNIRMNNELLAKRTTNVRYMIEDEYDLVKKQMDRLVAEGQRDEVIESRMKDMQIMYNEYMETFEL